MIDDLNLHVRDVERRRAFYAGALAPVGYRVMLEPAPGVVGLGADRPHFWLALEPASTGFAHVAFGVDTTDLVDAFHRAALDAGGRDNGAPGPRPQYHPRYYGAFVLDRAPRAKPVVGNNVEAVCHAAEAAA
jgi:catechol 2,3-dioxygenase-like lactoylglutathione lyase family enzyme